MDKNLYYVAIQALHVDILLIARRTILDVSLRLYKSVLKGTAVTMKLLRL